MNSAPAYKIIGVTDEVTSCDCCGRTNLKRTVVLERTEDGVIVYFGSDCGARAVGWATKEFTTTAKAAQKNRIQEVRRFLYNHPAYIQRMKWMDEHYRSGGSYNDAPFAAWKDLEAQAKAATQAAFHLTDTEMRRLYA